MSRLGAQQSSVWAEVLPLVADTAVYLDDKAAELLHWQGGIVRLLDAGALEVKEFSCFETAASSRVAVIILSQPVTAVVQQTLQDIVAANSFSSVSVITNASPRLHASALRMSSSDPEHVFNTIQGELISQLPVSVSLRCLPYHCVQLSPSEPLLLLPHASLDNLPHCLADLLWALELAPECFAPAEANTISAAKTLSQLAGSWPHTGRISVLLVERRTDLFSACSYVQTNLLQNVLSTLPRLPGHSIDVAVPMTPYFTSEILESPLSGCLAHPSSTVCSRLFSSFLKDDKAVALASAVEVARKLGKVAKFTSRDDTEKLATALGKIRAKKLLDEVVQLVEAAGLVGLDEICPALAEWQKQLRAARDDITVIKLLTRIISNESTKFSVGQVVAIVLYGLCLTKHPLPSTHLTSLAGVLATRLAAAPEEETDSLPDPLQLTEQLVHLASQQTISDVPLLPLLLEQAVVDPANSHWPLQHFSSKLSGKLLSSFSLFGATAKLKDCDRVLIHVTGGVTLPEYNSLVSRLRPHFQEVYISSDKIFTPTDVIDYVLSDF